MKNDKMFYSLAITVEYSTSPNRGDQGNVTVHSLNCMEIVSPFHLGSKIWPDFGAILILV